MNLCRETLSMTAEIPKGVCKDSHLSAKTLAIPPLFPHVTGSQNSIHTSTLIGREKVTATFSYHNKSDISLDLHLLVAGKFKNQRFNSNEIHSGPII